MSKRSAAYYITLVCAVLCGFVAVAAQPPSWWQPAPGTTWQWQLTEAVNTIPF